MKRYRLESFTGPSGLHMEDIALAQPGAGEVLVRLRASSLNFRDLMIANGAFGPLVPAGTVPLSDGAGEVAAVGDGVRRVAVGERVCVTYNVGWISGERLDIGMGRGADAEGLLSEYALVDEDSLVRLPAHLSFEEGATLPCAAVTAWNALCVYGVLLPGQTVLTQGSGGVSLFALQFAKLFGAQVIVTTSSAAKAERLRALGADAVIDYRSQPDWEQEVLRLTGGAGADVVVEVGGAATMPKSILATRRGGRISVVGLLTGIADQGFAPAFFGRFVQFHHIHVGSRDSFEDMNRAIAHHGLQPVIGKRFDFERAPEAFAALGESEHFGKLVIRHPWQQETQKT